MFLRNKVKFDMMNKTIFLLIKFVIIVGLLSVHFAQANMLISPMRVVINDRERSAQVILINTSTKPKSYRVEWIQKRALSEGGYKNLNPEQAANFPTASDMFRISPRQVTLQSGARQIIKLAARRPKDLPDGEYRSHLQFTALPSQSDTDNTGNTGIRLNLLMNYSIPIILRKGPLDFNVIISDAKINQSMVKGKAKYGVNVSMLRTGKNSTYGSLVAYWTPISSQEETRVGVLNSFNFFSELEQSTRDIFWQFPEIVPQGGKLRVTYEGAKEYQGKVLAEKLFNF
jgi:fimbrial chaperone protein